MDLLSSFDLFDFCFVFTLLLFELLLLSAFLPISNPAIKLIKKKRIIIADAIGNSWKKGTTELT